MPLDLDKISLKQVRQIGSDYLKNHPKSSIGHTNQALAQSLANFKNNDKEMCIAKLVVVLQMIPSSGELSKSIIDSLASCGAVSKKNIPVIATGAMYGLVGTNDNDAEIMKKMSPESAAKQIRADLKKDGLDISVLLQQSQNSEQKNTKTTGTFYNGGAIYGGKDAVSPLLGGYLN
ncbi:hypothetical protein L3V86_00060 [Thiotrichales bacterium 19S11-10]|nr:hypothetical protein [Thiotrichales bacterium 19S11-10]